jgi:hypothetical protein
LQQNATKSARAPSLKTFPAKQVGIQHNMILKKPELSYFLSKRDGITGILYAIRRLFTLKLIVSEKSLNRMFEAIPGYIKP